MQTNNKLREALVLAIEVGNWCCAGTDDPLECCEFSCAYQVEPHGEAGADCPWRKIRAALAAPPRQCDVGTAEEQMIRFENFCFADCNANCPLYNNPKIRTSEGCALAWAQMPSRKEDDK